LCFQTNCSVRDQLLSFYVKNVFSHLGGRSDKLYVISAIQVLQANMNACHPCAPSTRLSAAVKRLKKTVLKLGERGIYKAIHELDILLPWIQAYIQT
ncbi:IL26 protein, partial [Tricholaema leucomelas]|nr:IL26 protein [Tricholaema leucomelas]